VIGYDSDNLDDIPADAQLVLYYDDGQPGSATPAQLERFPTAILQSITRSPNVVAYWGDVEPGCIWPISQAVTVWKENLVKGLYISESNWLALRQAISTSGTPPPPYWVAAYPDIYPTNPSIPQSWIDLGCVLWQFAGSPGTSPGHYDQSITIPNFPTPLPPPPVVLPKHSSLLLIGSTHAAD
jgi:hypothetical protein